MVQLPENRCEACPPPERLRDYTRGLLCEDLIDGVSQHSEHCTKCADALSDFEADPDAFLSNLRTTLHGFDGDCITEVDRELAKLISIVESQDSFGSNRSHSSPETNGIGSGTRVGEYDLLETLGRGGMGRVFRARHHSAGHTVAVKILERSRLDPRSQERFRRELTLSRQIASPTIVQILDSGEVDGQLYLVMEYLNGYDLAQLVCGSGPLKVADACEIIRQAAIAVGCCHERGILHRDIKPSNLLLTHDGLLKVLDLGLARCASDDETRITQTGQVMGTADYIAPEQGLDVRDAGPQSDIYSLGCMLYFLLAGRPPYDEYETFGKKLLAHVNAPHAPLREIRDDVSA